MPTVNERCKILRSLNRVYVFEIVLLLVPRLKILRRRGLSYFGILEKQEAQSSFQETNHNKWIVFVRPKSVGWLHSECAQVSEFFDGLDFMVVLLHIIWLPQRFW